MKKIAWFLFILSSFSLEIFAQEADEKLELTVEQAVEYAMINSTTIKSQQIELKNLEKKSSYSWNNFIPTASVSGSYKPSFVNDNDSSWNVTGSLSLRLSPSVYTTMKDASLNYKTGQDNYDSAVRKLDMDVRKAFLKLLYSKENLTLQERNLETARQRYNSSREKYNQGRLSELDLLNAQYTYESLKPALESQKIEYESSLASFKQSIGISLNTQIILKGNLEDYYKKYNLDFEYDPENLPSVIKSEAQLESAENRLMATRFSAWGPSLSASYSYNVGTAIAKKDEISKSNSLSFGFSIPLDGFLPWSNGALSIDTQKGSVETIKMQVENQKETASFEIETYKKKIQQAISQLTLYESNVTLAQKTYNMTLTAYNHGSKDFLTLQNASDSLLKAKISVQSQKYTIISLVMDLENALGLPFGSLEVKTE